MGNYLSKNGYKAGQATWKFVLSDRVIYRLKNRDAIYVWTEVKDTRPCKIYVRSNKKRGWHLALDHYPPDKCSCGREYTTPNGESFMFQEHPLEYKIESIIQFISSPILCAICYYGEELKAGRWAPKFVRKELGLEI